MISAEANIYFTLIRNSSQQLKILQLERKMLRESRYTLSSAE